MAEARYAIFFVPPRESALYTFGAAVLGYDSYSGAAVPSAAAADLGAERWRRLTAEPRRYGFHATLKAPFRMREEASEQELIAAFAKFPTTGVEPLTFAAAIRLLDGFAAVVPIAEDAPLTTLASRCVKYFDRFRAPLSDQERERRRPSQLTPRQRDYLDRWGYPYVFADFRAHMTLTGRIPDADEADAMRVLAEVLARQPVPAAIAVERLSLLRQDGPDAAFRIVSQCHLTGGSGRDEPSDPESRFLACLPSALAS